MAKRKKTRGSVKDIAERARKAAGGMSKRASGARDALGKLIAARQEAAGAFLEEAMRTRDEAEAARETARTGHEALETRLGELRETKARVRTDLGEAVDEILGRAEKAGSRRRRMLAGLEEGAEALASATEEHWQRLLKGLGDEDRSVSEGAKLAGTVADAVQSAERSARLLTGTRGARSEEVARDRARRANLLGCSELARGHPDAALPLFADGCSGCEDAEPRYNLALARFLTGDLPGSRKSLEEAEDAGIDPARAETLRGLVELRAGEYDNARQATASAVATDPDSPLAALLHALALLTAGASARAIRLLADLGNRPGSLPEDWGPAGGLIQSLSSLMPPTSEGG